MIGDLTPQEMRDIEEEVAIEEANNPPKPLPCRECQQADINGQRHGADYIAYFPTAPLNL